MNVHRIYRLITTYQIHISDRNKIFICTVYIGCILIKVSQLIDIFEEIARFFEIVHVFR